MEDRFGLKAEGKRSSRPSWLAFRLVAIPGSLLYILAFFVLNFLGCHHPPDGSVAICEEVGNLNVWLFPVIALIHVGAAIWLHIRSSLFGLLLMAFGAFPALFLSDLLASGLARLLV